MPRLLNFGSLNLDKTYSVPHIIRPGETLAATHYDVFIGGKGLNQSIALARAGADVMHAGLVGETDGDALLARLEENDVDTTLVEKRPLPSGHTIIQVDDSGANCIIVEGGANRAVDAAFAEKVLSQFNTGDVLILQNEISALAEIVDMASARGMKIVLNPSPMDERLQALDLSKIDIFVVNEGEGAAMTGAEVPEDILNIYSERFPHQTVILTLGEKGAWYQGAAQPFAMSQGADAAPAGKQVENATSSASSPAQAPLRFYTPAETIKPVDTTGAGDTFSGYLIAGLISGLTPQQAMARATKAAAIACLTKGASNAIPRWEDVPWTDQ